MCWKGYKSEAPVCHVAEADFYVYKVMINTNDGLLSYFMRSSYKESIVYSLDEVGDSLVTRYKERSRGMLPHTCIESGFHSYTGECRLEYKEPTGFMAMCDNGYIQYYENNNIVLARCVIPKGSKYYKNDYEEIVSDRIIVDSVIINPHDVIHYNAGCGTNKEYSFKDLDSLYGRANSVIPCL